MSIELIAFVDDEGRDIWINPLLVQQVVQSQNDNHVYVVINNKRYEIADTAANVVTALTT